MMRTPGVMVSWVVVEFAVGFGLAVAAGAMAREARSERTTAALRLIRSFMCRVYTGYLVGQSG